MRFITVIVCGLLMPAVALADQQPQTLVCRGGGQMRVTIDHGRDPSGAQTEAIVMIRYKKAVAPASANAPGVGECALLTQPFRPSDPDVVFLKSKRAEAVLDLWADGRVVVDASGTHAHGESPDVYEKRFWDGVLQAVFTGQPFAVTVYPPVQLRGAPSGWLANDIAQVPQPQPQN